MSTSNAGRGQELGPFEWTMGILGTAVSASAAISLVQHWSDVVLADIPALYVGYYRTIMRSLVDWIPLPLDWRIPQWYLDALAVNGIVAGAAVRAIYSVGYFQARLFAFLIWTSAVILVGWLVGPSLVEWLNQFSRTSIRDARERLEKWRAEVEHRKVTHPGMVLTGATKQIQDDEAAVERYGQFLAVRRAFRLGLATILIATVVFFVLNSLAPQPTAQGGVTPNPAMHQTATGG